MQVDRIKTKSLYETLNNLWSELFLKHAIFLGLISKIRVVEFLGAHPPKEVASPGPLQRFKLIIGIPRPRQLECQHQAAFQIFQILLRVSSERQI